MLAVLDTCPIRGVFSSTGGEPWSDDDIATAIGGDRVENLGCIAELLAKEVAFRNERGAIYSRRMVREEQERANGTARVQKHRNKKRGCNGDVTPDVLPLNSQKQESTKPKELNYEFSLEDFDGQELFIRLCEAHPKPEENDLAAHLFHECVEWAIPRKGFKTRKESAEWIIEKAKRYAEVADFKQGLINWLDKKTFNQLESAWKSGGKSSSNVSEFYDANGVSKFAKSGVSRKLDAGTRRGTGPETA